MENFIRALFKEVIESSEYDESLIHRYFSEQYMQSVDGQTLDYQQFKKHIQKLKDKTRQVDVTFDNIAFNRDSVFTKHRVDSILKSGEVVSHKVLAEFRLSEGKVIQCDELTMLVKGSQSQSNLASTL